MKKIEMKIELIWTVVFEELRDRLDDKYLLFLHNGFGHTQCMPCYHRKLLQVGQLHDSFVCCSSFAWQVSSLPLFRGFFYYWRGLLILRSLMIVSDCVH